MAEKIFMIGRIGNLGTSDKEYMNFPNVMKSDKEDT